MPLNEHDPIRRVALRHPREAFRDQGFIDRSWQGLGYRAAPDFAEAVREFDRFAELIAETGAEVCYLPAAQGLEIDSIYVRDASLCGPGGALLCSMGREARRAEPAVSGAAFEDLGLPVSGAIDGAGRVEGGDFVWLDDRTGALGLTYRSNAEGARQLAEHFGPDVTLVTVDVPHYKGPGDVFHLMSMLSPLDRDLALVYSPLMPIGFRSWLQERGIALVEVPDEEFETMACNVLALAPRHCLMLEGCPETRRRLEAAGCEVRTYKGEEISRKGEGGPTCLTRPLERG